MADLFHTFTDVTDGVAAEREGIEATLFSGDRGPQGPQGDPGSVGPKGDAGTDGVDGQSAYELAVEAGFVGTEAAWLDSLQGADGQDGLPGTTTWAGITDKPTIPDSADDIGAETPAGAQAKADAAEAAANAYTDTALTGVGGGAVDSVNGQTGVVVLDAADVSARPDTYVPTWGEVTGKPTIPTTPGEVGADPAGSAAAAQAAAATDATTKANTAEANAKAASTPIAHATDTTNPHAVTKAQVGLGSVDNVSAASLRDRATHTGTQAATSITGLATVATSGAYADLSGKPTIPAGLPTGGPTGYVLGKNSPTDYDTGWIAGGGVAVTQAKFVVRKSGDVTITGSTYQASIGTDLTLTAAVDDVIEVGLSGRFDFTSNSVFIFQDIATIVGGSAVSYLSGAGSGGEGVGAWHMENVSSWRGFGGSVLYIIKVGDLSAGSVTLRALARVSGTGSRKISADGGHPFHFWAKNLGH